MVEDAGPRDDMGRHGTTWDDMGRQFGEESWGLRVVTRVAPVVTMACFQDVSMIFWGT